MPPAGMEPLLGRAPTPHSSASRLNRRTAGAAAMGAAIAYAAYAAIVRLESVLHTAPHLTPLLPAVAVTAIALLLPLAVFIGCQAEFGPGVAPWTPRGYGLIARRTYSAFAAAQGSGGKVGGKDL